MKCPMCGNELRRSDDEPTKGLCDSCKAKFDWTDDDEQGYTDYSNYASSLNDYGVNDTPTTQIQYSAPKKRKKHTGLIVVGMCFMFLLGFAGGSFTILAKLSGGAKNAVSFLQSDNITSDSESQTESTMISDFLTCPIFTAEENTTEMIDEISKLAKANASNMTDEQATEIISSIKAADHQFYNSPKAMEKYMWYGYLLDYKYADSDARSELGTDLVQAIKYVYRNLETVLDDATHENLLQIDKDLEQIK